MIDLVVNGQTHRLEIPPEMPLLWALRDNLGLTGAKFSCGTGICGACTVLMAGEAIRSCIVPVSAVSGPVTTIEGLSNGGNHPLQQAWLAEQVPQCGYCQSGQIMSAAALLMRIPRPDDSQIDAAMSGVLCRCGTYRRIRAAIHRTARFLPVNSPPETAPATPAPGARANSEEPPAP